MTRAGPRLFAVLDPSGHLLAVRENWRQAEDVARGIADQGRRAGWQMGKPRLAEVPGVRDD